MKKRTFLQYIVAMFSAVMTTACGSKPTQYYFAPYQAKALEAPAIKHCFDSIGHKRGTFPYIFGGTCCCTPSEKLLAAYHKDGFLKDYDLARLRAEYEQRGIVLRHENGFACNNMCSSGPHIVFGGKCMVAPTYGTQNYENVASGVIHNKA